MIKIQEGGVRYMSIVHLSGGALAHVAVDPGAARPRGCHVAGVGHRLESIPSAGGEVAVGPVSTDAGFTCILGQLCF